MKVCPLDRGPPRCSCLFASWETSCYWSPYCIKFWPAYGIMLYKARLATVHARMKRQISRHHVSRSTVLKQITITIQLDLDSVTKSVLCTVHVVLIFVGSELFLQLQFPARSNLTSRSLRMESVPFWPDGVGLQRRWAWLLR